MSERYLPYHVVRRGRNFAVYKWNDWRKCGGTWVSEHWDRESARTEAYRLNGEWMKSGLPFKKTMKTEGLNSEMRRDSPCFNCKNGNAATGEWFIKCIINGKVSKYEYNSCLLHSPKS